MAVQKFNLLSKDEQNKQDLVFKVKSGEVNSDNYSSFDKETQEKIKEILFEMSSSQVDPSEGASTLEFILMAFIRIAMKKMNNISLNSEDVKIEQRLMEIMKLHEITNDTPMNKWLFNYMDYAHYKTEQFLKNRTEHIERKKKVTGQA